MSKKERIEDLGRVRERLSILLDESEAIEAGGMHDDAFMEKYAKEDALDDLRRSLRGLNTELWEIWAIADGDESEVVEKK